MTIADRFPGLLCYVALVIASDAIAAPAYNMTSTHAIMKMRQEEKRLSTDLQMSGRQSMAFASVLKAGLGDTYNNVNPSFFDGEKGENIISRTISATNLAGVHVSQNKENITHIQYIMSHTRALHIMRELVTEKNLRILESAAENSSNPSLKRSAEAIKCDHNTEVDDLKKEEELKKVRAYLLHLKNENKRLANENITTNTLANKVSEYDANRKPGQPDAYEVIWSLAKTNGLEHPFDFYLRSALNTPKDTAIAWAAIMTARWASTHGKEAIQEGKTARAMRLYRDMGKFWYGTLKQI